MNIELPAIGKKLNGFTVNNKRFSGQNEYKKEVKCPKQSK
jgi:hypothetical protein